MWLKTAHCTHLTSSSWTVLAEPLPDTYAGFTCLHNSVACLAFYSKGTLIHFWTVTVTVKAANAMKLKGQTCLKHLLTAALWLTRYAETQNLTTMQLVTQTSVWPRIVLGPPGELPASAFAQCQPPSRWAETANKQSSASPRSLCIDQVPCSAFPGLNKK